MSLEASIAELNTNIVALIGVMSGASPVSTPAPAATPAKSGTKKPQPVAALEAAKPTPSPAASAPQPVAAPPAGKTPAITYEEARKLVILLGQKTSREVVMELFTEYGVAKLPDLNPVHYPKLVATINALIAKAEVA